MTELGLATRLSPFATWLFAPSPPQLPSVPSLSELQKRAAELRQSVSESVSVQSYLTSSTTQSDARPIATTQTGLKSWYAGGSPPPKYAVKDPLQILMDEREKDQEAVTKLKKGRKGWRRLKTQEGIPDEATKPRMQGSRTYVQTAEVGRQPCIGEVEWSNEAKSQRSFWSW